eukprot:6481169-Amphidinium_carterae.1
MEQKRNDCVIWLWYFVLLVFSNGKRTCFFYFPNPLLLPGGDPGALGSNPVSPPGRGEGLGKI